MPQKNKLKLSIVVPIYNEETYIKILIQKLIFYFNYKNIEIIFVNDGSVDHSRKIIEDMKAKNNYKFIFKIVNLDKNYGKGRAVREGLSKSLGEYVILQDADLELDIKDSKELFEIITSNNEIKCIFGSRYLSGKLKKHNYFFNELFGKINSLIFNIFFGQSLSDIHCGLKVLSREVVNKINLSINDFGLEIDLASQIVKNKFYIYEFGVSYYSRTKYQGKKITWLDGLKSYYYLIKVRFIDNPAATQLSLIFSAIYMTFVGSYFGMGTGKVLFMIIFFCIGLYIGLKNKFFSSAIVFFFIYMGSFFGNGQGKVLSVFLFFILGLYLAKKTGIYIKKKFANHDYLF